MKINLLRCAGLVAIIATGSAHSESADESIEAFNERVANDRKNNATTVNVHLQKADETVEVTAKTDSLIGRTSFLTDGQRTVIIPKGAVLSLAGQNRLSEGSRIVGKLVEWEEFLRANRAVLELIEIPGNQLYKPEPIDAAIIERIQENKLVGVTTYQSRPVAVKLPPEPSPEPTKP